MNPPTQIPPYSSLVEHAEPIDGDTIRVHLDRGFYDFKSICCRLQGIDTPEQHSVAGKLVTLVVENWIRANRRLAVVSYAKDKYENRFIGNLYAIDQEGVVSDSLVAHLQRNQLCRAYDGGKKDDWAPEEIAAIEANARNLLERAKT